MGAAPRASFNVHVAIRMAVAVAVAIVIVVRAMLVARARAVTLAMLMVVPVALAPVRAPARVAVRSLHVPMRAAIRRHVVKASRDKGVGVLEKRRGEERRQTKPRMTGREG